MASKSEQAMSTGKPDLDSLAALEAAATPSDDRLSSSAACLVPHSRGWWAVLYLPHGDSAVHHRHYPQRWMAQFAAWMFKRCRVEARVVR